MIPNHIFDVVYKASNPFIDNFATPCTIAVTDWIEALLAPFPCLELRVENFFASLEQVRLSYFYSFLKFMTLNDCFFATMSDSGFGTTITNQHCFLRLRA